MTTQFDMDVAIFFPHAVEKNQPCELLEESMAYVDYRLRRIEQVQKWYSSLFHERDPFLLHVLPAHEILLMAAILHKHKCYVVTTQQFVAVLRFACSQDKESLARLCVQTIEGNLPEETFFTALRVVVDNIQAGVGPYARAAMNCQPKWAFLPAPLMGRHQFGKYFNYRGFVKNPETIPLQKWQELFATAAFYVDEDELHWECESDCDVRLGDTLINVDAFLSSAYSAVLGCAIVTIEDMPFGMENSIDSMEEHLNKRNWEPLPKQMYFWDVVTGWILQNAKALQFDDPLLVSIKDATYAGQQKLQFRCASKIGGEAFQQWLAPWVKHYRPKFMD